MNIMGKPELTKEQMLDYLCKVNPQAPIGIEYWFLYFGEMEGVRGDLAFCQSLLETGNFKFGGTAKREWHNPAGLGVTGEENKGERFLSWSDGILAQIQHLKAYASTEKLKTVLLDNRFHLVQRGIAPTIYDLNGRWAVPGTDYGQKIVAIYKEIEKIKIQPTPKFDEIEQLIEDVSSYIQMDKPYWVSILKGKNKLNPEYLKIIFKRFVENKRGR